MAKPTDNTAWALSATASAIVEPTSKRTAGWVPGDEPPAEWLNWWQRAVYRWIAWYDTVLSTTDDQTVTITSLSSASSAALRVTSGAATQSGITGVGNTTGIGVSGTGGASSGSGVVGTGGATNGKGVVGVGTGSGRGVEGTGGATNGSKGVYGTSAATNGGGVVGLGTGTGYGVEGTGGATNASGVFGTGGATNGIGVQGVGTGTGSGVDGASSGGSGVTGTSTLSSGIGVLGVSNTGVSAAGVKGTSTSGKGVWGASSASGQAAGYFVGTNGASGAYAVYGITDAGGITAEFVQSAGTGANVYCVKVTNSASDGGGLWANSSGGPVTKLTSNGVGCSIRMDTLGAVPSGASFVGDLYMTTAGVLKVCTANGTGGAATWVSVGTQT